MCVMCTCALYNSVYVNIWFLVSKGVFSVVEYIKLIIGLGYGYYFSAVGGPIYPKSQKWALF